MNVEFEVIIIKVIKWINNIYLYVEQIWQQAKHVW